MIKHLILLQISKYHGYQRELASMVYTFLIKKTFGSAIKSENMTNQHPLDLYTQELAEELHKPVIRKFKKRKYTHLL